MTSIDRTVYPRFKKAFTVSELEQVFKASEEELSFAKSESKKSSHYFTLLTLMKCQQYLGYFPSLKDVPQQVQNYLRVQIGLLPVVELLDDKDDKLKKDFHLFRKRIRSFRDIKPYKKGGKIVASTQMENSAYTMSDPADLINVAIEKLIQQRFELPAFSTLNRMAGSIRTRIHEEIYSQITEPLTEEEIQRLDSLLKVAQDERITDFTKLKQTPGKASLKQMNLWSSHLDWMTNILQPQPFLEGIAHTKIRQFASEAKGLEVSDMNDIKSDQKRYSLMICLIQFFQVKCRDQLALMFLKRMKRTHNTAREKLKILQDKYREIEELIMEMASKIAEGAIVESKNEPFGKHSRQILDAYGGAEKILEQYKLVGIYHHQNYLPLLWDIHRPHRAALFRLITLLNIQSATQDNSLIEALRVIQTYQKARRDYIPCTISLDFASDRWKTFVTKKIDGEKFFKRRELEVCIFSYLAEGLRCADLFVPGSEEYSDYRQQMLSLEECEKRLPAYCSELGFPQNAKGFVGQLKKALIKVSHKIDKHYPENEDLMIDHDGVPHLRRLSSNSIPEGLEKFKENLRKRMPEHHLLDILKDVQHWLNYACHFHLASGSEAKMPDSVSRYLLTVFGYGCNLGPAQTARHIQEKVSQRILKKINDQHISSDKLESASKDIINEYTHFELPKLWGSGQAAIADGTHVKLRENNLLGERHIRYGGYGGIAYHHVSDTYIALFSHFIACGVWEAVYIFDGLLKNQSEIQPDTLYADTQGQSEPAFGLAYLLGIHLLPRMRNWNDVIFYRPDKQIEFDYIAPLFTETINWELIERHWQDLMQVALSIQAGKVLPSMLLQKLGVYSKKNKLYRAFRELGRVGRTLFLLEFIDDKTLRRRIRSETTKVESFNAFLDWISFGGLILTSGDPVEQEKRIKYTNLVANNIMMRNVYDMTKAIKTMISEGEIVTTEMLQHLSPYMTEHIKRFGYYTIDMEEKPEPLLPENLILKSDDFN